MSEKGVIVQKSWVQFTSMRKKIHVLPFTNPREIIFKDTDSQKSFILTSPVYSVGSGTSLTAEGNQHTLHTLTLQTKKKTNVFRIGLMYVLLPGILNTPFL